MHKILKETIHWVLVVYLAFYVLTGLGILYWQKIEPMTLGLLGKARATHIHDNLHFPFAALVTAHVIVSLIWRDKD